MFKIYRKLFTAVLPMHVGADAEAIFIILNNHASTSKRIFKIDSVVPDYFLRTNSQNC